MTRHQSSNRARNVVVVGILLVLAAMIWFVYGRAAPKSLPQPLLATLKSELAGIRPPAGSRLEAPAEEEFRIGTTQVTQRFELQQPADEARAHLRAELLSHGWRLKSSDSAAVWDDTYCKSSIVAHVKLAQDARPLPHVAVSMLWNQISLLLCGSQPA